MDNTLVLNVIYTVVDGKRDEFYNTVQREKIPEMSRLENGNLKYEYYFSVEDKNKLLLIEIWKSKSFQEIHKETEHFKKLQSIKQKYVTDVELREYSPN